MNKIISALRLHPKHIFLIDALGALLTAFLLGVILVQFSAAVGVPIKTLSILASIAFFFATYSFLCFFFVKTHWRPFLKIIAILNLLYCGTTLFLIFANSHLTLLGLFYFITEIFIIVFLAILELKLSNQKA